MLVCRNALFMPIKEEDMYLASESPEVVLSNLCSTLTSQNGLDCFKPQRERRPV